MYRTAPTRADAHPQALPSLLRECAWFVRRSRSLASMLPSLLASGLVTLASAWLTLLVASGTEGALPQSFGETWLVSWALAFPVAYLFSALLLKFAAWVSTAVDTRPGVDAGLAFRDIAEVSARAGGRHRCTVTRGLKPANCLHG